MRAAILQSPRNFKLETMAMPEVRRDEILVRTAVCGICTSELDMWEGKAVGLEFPRFIGHEVSGIVEAIGSDVTTVKNGDHVSLYAQGKGYAEYVVVPERVAVRLSPQTPFDLALGEPIACATNGVRKAAVQLNDSVCIIGCGFMGLIMTQVFKAAGAGMVIAVDTRESILEIARQVGASHTFNPRSGDVRREVKDLTDGAGVDIGVEAGGIQETLDLTSDLVRMEGKLEVFGFHQGPPRTVPWGYWNWMAFNIINGHSRSEHVYVEGMRIGLSLLESGRLRMERLVTHRFTLEQMNLGFEQASTKPDGFVKGVLQFA
jgi:2-desacetyl-2-hydroxyethyl bacteriochlorophyllide A dehydrogenase